MIIYYRCTKSGKMYSGDDHSHHPWQGPVPRETTEEISESLLVNLYILCVMWQLQGCTLLLNSLTW